MLTPVPGSGMKRLLRGGIIHQGGSFLSLPASLSLSNSLSLSLSRLFQSVSFSLSLDFTFSIGPREYPRLFFISDSSRGGQSLLKTEFLPSSGLLRSLPFSYSLSLFTHFRQSSSRPLPNVFAELSR